MRLWILSDLHIEQSCWDLPEPRPEYDVLVAAGDIHNAVAGVRWLGDRANGRPVIYVPGNHEWYGADWPSEAQAAKAKAKAQRLGVHFLMDEGVTIGDVHFVGATLWTDYELHDPTAGRAMDYARRWMSDHLLIHSQNGLFDPTEARELHMASKAWIANELSAARPEVRKTVVVTHHLPLRRSVAPQFNGDPLSPAFASDIPELVECGGADLWIHGHTHVSCDYHAGNCRVVCNPKGYGPRVPGGPIENRQFDPSLVIEI
jgi:predicted phosphodiesterase